MLSIHSFARCEYVMKYVYCDTAGTYEMNSTGVRSPIVNELKLDFHVDFTTLFTRISTLMSIIDR